MRVRWFESSYLLETTFDVSVEMKDTFSRNLHIYFPQSLNHNYGVTLKMGDTLFIQPTHAPPPNP